MTINPLFAKVLATTAAFVLLLIPLSMIRDVIVERAHYRDSVAARIAEQWTGPQVLTGPVVALSYRVRYTEKVWLEDVRRHVNEEKTRTEMALLVPATLDANVVLPTEFRAYGIHEVPVYAADVRMTGTVTQSSIDAIKAAVEGFDAWLGAEIVLGVSDRRGLAAEPDIVVAAEPRLARPGADIAGGERIVSAALPLTLLDADFPFDVTLRLRGSASFGFVPLAAEGRYQLDSTWPHPSFSGRFLPMQRQISEAGFTAVWEVSRFASSAAQRLGACDSLDCAALQNDVFRVGFTDPVDIYVKAERASKYAVLFILVTFVAFFLLETLTGRYLHTVQYGLVGASLVVFFLLLLSFAEHIGFSAAYAIATVACATLAGFYLKPVLGPTLALVFILTQTTLNGLLFGILRSEDHALIAGTLLVFGVLTAVMAATRRVDWRRFGRRSGSEPQRVSS